MPVRNKFDNLWSVLEKLVVIFNLALNKLRTILFSFSLLASFGVIKKCFVMPPNENFKCSASFSNF